MDKSDTSESVKQVRREQDPLAGLLVHRLDAGLWPASGPLRRSRELTPLFIQRYPGPRRSRNYTAHDFWELTFVFHGSGVLQGDQPVDMQPGIAVLLPPGYRHREQSGGRMDTLWVGLLGSRLAATPARTPVVASGTELARIVDALWLRAGHPVGLIGPELDALCLALLGKIFSGSPRTADGAGVAGRAVAWIRLHYAEDFSVSDLARRFGCSEGHLHREFKREVGKSPLQFLNQLRVGHATHWLRNSLLPVAEIAAKVGFADALYFSRVCHKLTGFSPTALRAGGGSTTGKSGIPLRGRN